MSDSTRHGSPLRWVVAFLLVTVFVSTTTAGTVTPAREWTTTIDIRGHAQTLHLYGERSGEPIIISSGDGGWMHLGPHVAEFLAARGLFVVGFDARAYLEGFTSTGRMLEPVDEPGDYDVLVRFARGTGKTSPILVGVSEGAGLSLLAATDPRTKAEIAGVIGLGLPDVNELAWRWSDMATWFTHKPPHEPVFHASSIAGRVSPLPLAAIQSAHDEFVSRAEIDAVMQAAKDPKRLWIVDASNHRFSGNVEALDQRLLEAIAWVHEHHVDPSRS